MTTSTLGTPGQDAEAGTRGLPARLGDFTTDRRVILLMAIAVFVGTAGVGAAFVLLRLITLSTNIAYYGRFSLESLPISGTQLGWTAMFVPVIGCLIIGLMARYGSEKIRGHGIPEAMEAILIGKSRINPKVAVLKPLSSAISIGSGGPFGAEGPIIMTGGAIGSLVAQMIHLSANERKALLVAGAAAGMTAVFGTPIAAVLLAIELLLFEWKPRSFLPVVVAASVAAAERGLLLDPTPLFGFTGHMALTFPGFLDWVLMGIIAGLGSGILTAMVYASEDFFHRLPLHWMWWPLFGGLAIGIGGLFDPSALGVGYDNIRHLLSGEMAVKAVLLLLAVKSLIWSISLGSGTSGGVLAPLMMLGGALGTLVGLVLPQADPGFWALLGMAAMMGGTMRAPLTATLFAVELTGNLGVLLPLLTACGMAYATTVLTMKRSILTEKIARRGHHISGEYHTDPFDLARVADLMVREVDTLPAAMTVARAVAFFTSGQPCHKSYPVVDAERRVVGMVSRAHILDWSVHASEDDDIQSLSLEEILEGQDLEIGYADELAGALADRMAIADIGRVPVLDRRSGSLVGLIARKDLLRVRAHRRAEEHDRGVMIRLRARGARGI